MTAYQTLAEFKGLTLMPSTHVDRLEAQEPGWIGRQLEAESRNIDTRLGKRYRTPFALPAPLAVTRWLTMIVTPRCYLKLGAFESDEQQKMIFDDAQRALTEIKEAADAQSGLFDLPLTDSVVGTGIVFGGPLVYSEQSPYVAGDVQVDIGLYEDQARRGT